MVYWMAYIPVSEQAKTPPHTSHVNIDIQNTKHNPRRSVLRRDSYEKHPTLTELLETRHQQGFAEMKPIFSKSFLFVALVQSVNGLLGCGTWSWGNKLLWDYDPSQDEEIYRAYRAVRNAGVTIFDTADSYGTFELNGRAEILLGQFERPSKQNKQQVATKFAPYPWRITSGSLVNAAKESLKRLEQDKLSVAQLHWSTQNYQPFQEKALWEGIADVYDAGLCEAVGISNYGPNQLQKFSQRMQERDVPIAIAQVQYSLLTARNNEILDSCNEVGCRLISYSPLCLGLLSGKYNVDNLPKPGNPRRQLFRELLPGASPLLRTLKAVADDVGKTQSQVAINWAMCKGTVPIPGARNLVQAEENLGAIGWSLSKAAVEELDIASARVSKKMIENIFQTK
ncbi:aldo/keto reductase [Thalassiosira pseudonana CCMP1335]|uniref:Aldo/keto reductase n=1 Tax=Thalassiosira pseudonana TaxID=35128 RepID=B8BTV2_THAPS|nr:aldo/keto reductase [Thalassiosira pseudonana CCMP1335]EED94662.1 aldo/keto reductase [Thalassiosira pseudonana CCMP1335]